MSISRDTNIGAGLLLTALGDPDPVSGLYLRMLFECHDPAVSLMPAGSKIQMTGADGGAFAMLFVDKVRGPGVFECHVIPD